MKNPEPALFDLQKMLVDLCLINRNHYLAGTDKRENDIEHTFSVVVLCWYIFENNKIDLDFSKILKYAIAHDFVERYAGDVNTYASADERAKKVEAEKESFDKISAEFKNFPDMIDAMKNYEDKIDEESLFVWTVDKMQQLVMGGLDDWRPYKEIDIRYDTFVSKCDEFSSKSSKYLKEIMVCLVEYSKGSYWDN